MQSALFLCFVAFPDGEPVSTSPGNALTPCTPQPGDGGLIRGDDFAGLGSAALTGLRKLMRSRDQMGKECRGPWSLAVRTRVTSMVLKRHQSSA